MDRWSDKKAHLSAFVQAYPSDYRGLNDLGAIQISEGNLTEISSPAVVIGSDEDGSITNGRLGVEVEVLTALAARAGIRYQYADYEFRRTDLQSLTGNSSGIALSAGAGYSFGEDDKKSQHIHLDYGFEYSHIGNGNWQHILSLTVPL
jgi:opacity protein-like surface antigen